MKNLLISSVVAAGLLGGIANAKSGAFVGINVGVPITTASYSGAIAAIQDYLPKSGVGYALGVDLGYKQMFGEGMFGLRYYVDYYFSQSFGSGQQGFPSFGAGITTTIDAAISQHLVNANIDVLFNPLSWLGVYVGIGVGYQGYNPIYTITATQDATGATVGTTEDHQPVRGGFSLPLNVGLNFNLGESHALNVGAKIPLVGYDYSIASFMNTPIPDSSVGLRSYIIKVGYSYTF